MLSVRLEPARLATLLGDVVRKLPLPSAGPAKKFEEAEGALSSAAYLLAPALAGVLASCIRSCAGGAYLCEGIVAEGPGDCLIEQGCMVAVLCRSISFAASVTLSPRLEADAAAAFV